MSLLLMHCVDSYTYLSRPLIKNECTKKKYGYEYGRNRMFAVIIYETEIANYITKKIYIWKYTEQHCALILFK